VLDDDGCLGVAAIFFKRSIEASDCPRSKLNHGTPPAVVIFAEASVARKLEVR
jgi:hypothetical protein